MFGHHDTPYSVINSMTVLLRMLAEENHVDRFLVGNQGSFDRMAYKALTESVIPEFPQADYRVVLAYLPSVRPLDPMYNAAKTVYPEGLENVPPRFAISRRNRWMVDQSDIVLGYCRYSIGGTASILEYARKKKKTIVDLAEYADSYGKKNPELRLLKPSPDAVS